MRHHIADDINFHKLLASSRHLITHGSISHATFNQVSDVAHDILILRHVRLHPTKDTCKTMSCLIGHTPTTVLFPVNDISRMSSLTQQVNDLCHNPYRTRHSYTCRVRVTSTLWSTCSTTSFWTKALHVDSGVGVAPTISLCRVRSWFPYDLYVMSSPAQ